MTTTPLASQTRYPARACINDAGRPCTEVSLLEMGTYLHNDEILVSVSDDRPITVLLFVGSDAANLDPKECRQLATALLNAAELVETVTD